MKTSTFGSLVKHDFVKSFIVAVLTAVVGALLPILEAGTLPSMDSMKSAGIYGLAAGAAYLLKNLLTNSNDQFLKKEA